MDRFGLRLSMFALTILYIPMSKFAIDSLVWQRDLSKDSERCFDTRSQGGINWVQVFGTLLTAVLLYSPYGFLGVPVLYGLLSVSYQEGHRTSSSCCGPLQRGRGKADRDLCRVQ